MSRPKGAGGTSFQAARSLKDQPEWVRSSLVAIIRDEPALAPFARRSGMHLLAALRGLWTDGGLQARWDDSSGLTLLWPDGSPPSGMIRDPLNRILDQLQDWARASAPLVCPAQESSAPLIMEVQSSASFRGLIADAALTAARSEDARVSQALFSILEAAALQIPYRIAEVATPYGIAAMKRIEPSLSDLVGLFGSQTEMRGEIASIGAARRRLDWLQGASRVVDDYRYSTRSDQKDRHKADPADLRRPGVKVVRERRMQACKVYGSLIDLLCNHEVTGVIDRGDPLVPALRKALGQNVGPAYLDAIRDMTSLSQAVALPMDLRAGLQEIAFWEVPRHQWPATRDLDAWRASCWWSVERDGWRGNCYAIRPDYLQDDEVKDAILAAWKDVVAPAIDRAIGACLHETGREGETVWREGGYFQSLGYVGPRGRGVGSSVLYNPEHDAFPFRGTRVGSEPLRQVFREVILAFQAAIVGDRSLSGVRDAAERWHRYVASLEAVRLDDTKPKARRGWPGLLTEPWTSKCGRYQFVELTSADELVQEGLTMQHCVGTYYNICRAGQTKIFSLREDGARVATMEIGLPNAGEDKLLSLRRISDKQFKGKHNLEPGPHLKRVLLDFVAGIHDGSVPLNHEAVAAHQERARSQPQGEARYTTSWALARRLFPAYRDTLIFGAREGETLGDWLQRTGILERVEAAAREALDLPPIGRAEAEHAGVGVR